MEEAENYLAIWTVYDGPLDYPDLFVVRKWLINGQPEPVDSGVVVTGHTLQEVRDQLPPGLHRMPRAPEDDVNIVESWL